LVSVKRSNFGLGFVSMVFSKVVDVFRNLVYGSSFVSGVEKCIKDHNPTITAVVQNAGPEIFLAMPDNVTLLPELFFGCELLFFIWS